MVIVTGGHNNIKDKEIHFDQRERERERNADLYTKIYSLKFEPVIFL